MWMFRFPEGGLRGLYRHGHVFDCGTVDEQRLYKGDTGRVH